jgi:hypothetical protein
MYARVNFNASAGRNCIKGCGNETARHYKPRAETAAHKPDAGEIQQLYNAGR